MEVKKALEGLKIAMQTELNGIEFYRIAAEKTEDSKGKQVFKTLAEDEVKHFNELKKQYEHLLQDNHWLSNIELGTPSSFVGESPIFTDEIKTRIKERHFEMSALSIAALLESNSIDFYRKMKEESDDPAAKQLFEQLQKWEEKHLEAITKQMNILKEEYWADAHFTPLY
ncbi:MAG: ferritin family protein [candidate division WOR-3 bacterium]|nr:ferritin family protein [candidate division WOR-3 bacterium]